MVRAWRAIDRFEGRSSLRSWLYRIANNVCVDMVRSPQRRARPMEMGPSTPSPRPARRSPPEHAFVQPVADERVIDLRRRPGRGRRGPESIRLAFVAALQQPAPRQRAVLILWEVLRWQAAEVAELLDTTVASVNSALQRARATLAGDGEELDPTVDPEQQELLARYVDAFERYDIPALVALLRDDVVLSMPPFDLWLGGRRDRRLVPGPGHRLQGRQLLPVDVNGTAGFGNYHKAARAGGSRGPSRSSRSPTARSSATTTSSAPTSPPSACRPTWTAERRATDARPRPQRDGDRRARHSAR